MEAGGSIFRSLPGSPQRPGRSHLVRFPTHLGHSCHSETRQVPPVPATSQSGSPTHLLLDIHGSWGTASASKFWTCLYFAKNNSPFQNQQGNKESPQSSLDYQGRAALPKRMNFWKSSKRGSFPIQKFMLQIFAIINASQGMYSGKKAQHDFPKIHPFWQSRPSLSVQCTVLSTVLQHPTPNSSYTHIKCDDL